MRIDAVADVLQYAITYFIEDDVMNSELNKIAVTYFDSFELRPAVKFGYIFEGWYLDEQFNVAIDRLFDVMNDICLYAKFSAPIEYTIQYSLFEGVNSDNNLTHYIIENNFEFEAAFKDGYTFMGWYLEDEFINQIESTNGVYDNLTLYAYFSPIKYTITLNSSEGIIDLVKNPIKIVLDYCMPKLENELIWVRDISFDFTSLIIPNVDGYVFNGWYYDRDYSIKVGDGDAFDKDTTVYAQWIESNNYPYFTIGKIAELIGGPYESSFSKSAYYNFCVPIYTAGSITVKLMATNWTLNGQVKNSSSCSIYNVTKGTTLASINSSNKTVHTTLTLKVDANDVIRINFIAGGKTQTSVEITDMPMQQLSVDVCNSVRNVQIDYDSYYYLPAAVREGYNFLGWYTAYDRLFDCGVYTELTDLELFAKWEPKIMYQNNPCEKKYQNLLTLV